MVAEGSVERTIPYVVSVDETLDIGEDSGTPIDEAYGDRMPFEYNGTIDRVIIELEPTRLSMAGLQQLYGGLEHVYRVATE